MGVQIHWPVVEPQQAGPMKPSIQETWEAMEKLVDEVSAQLANNEV